MHRNTTSGEETTCQRRLEYSSLLTEFNAHQTPILQAMELATLDGRLIQSDPALGAIMGAVVAQESIKVLTKENRPIQGCLMVCAETMEAKILK